jgi:hypothetical protein
MIMIELGVSGYRDDWEARQQQLDALRQEVADAKGRLDEERAHLADLEARVAALKGEAPPPEPVKDAQAQPKPATRWPILIALVPLGVFLLLFIFAGGRSSPPPPLPSPLANIVGAPHAVDPLAQLPAARKLAIPGAELTSIELRYVKPDGTIDLEPPPDHGTGRAGFTFVVAPPPSRVDPCAPLGAPKPPGEPFRGSDVTLDAQGLRVASSVGGNGSFMVFGLRTTPLPEPACTTRQIWDAARAAGAPTNAVAHLTYRRSYGGDRPSWDFKIDGTSYAYTIADPECRVVSHR